MNRAGQVPELGNAGEVAFLIVQARLAIGITGDDSTKVANVPGKVERIRVDAVTLFLLARTRPVTFSMTQGIRVLSPGVTHDLKQPIGNRRCDPWVPPHRLRRHVSPEKLRRELEGQIEKSGEVQLQPLVGRGHDRQSLADRRGKVRQIRAVNKTLTDGAIR